MVYGWNKNDQRYSVESIETWRHVKSDRAEVKQVAIEKLAVDFRHIREIVSLEVAGGDQYTSR